MKRKIKEPDTAKEIESVRKRINNAYNCFSFADDPYLVDAAVFEIKSLEARYAYLLKILKKDDEN